MSKLFWTIFLRLSLSAIINFDVDSSLTTTTTSSGQSFQTLDEAIDSSLTADPNSSINITLLNVEQNQTKQYYLSNDEMISLSQRTIILK